MSTDELTPVPAEPPENVLEVLHTAELTVEGRMPWSSNGTFLTTLSVAGEPVARAVYKPLRGERPLWDFPTGLYRREVAAYELSAALGWDVVPPTVVRSEAPFGEGSLQLFVPADFEQHYFTLHEQRPDTHDVLRTICLFDVIANNTDRKGGHVLAGLDGRLWAIDNGLCFAAEFKLRTVIWEFAGERVDAELLAAVAGLLDEVPAAVADLLDDDEVDAMLQRAARVVERPRFPADPTGRRYPWPMV
ncbi:MAG: SCO1664 family protein [Acidimicrobiales bacterium]